MIADMLSNKKPSSIVTESFIGDRKLHFYLVLSPNHFKLPKDVWRNTTHFFNTKIPNKRELQQTAYNHSSDIDFKDFTNLYKKKVLQKPHSCLAIDVTLALDNSSRFR